MSMVHEYKLIMEQNRDSKNISTCILSSDYEKDDTLV